MSIDVNRSHSGISFVDRINLVFSLLILNCVEAAVWKCFAKKDFWDAPYKHTTCIPRRFATGNTRGVFVGFR